MTTSTPAQLPDWLIKGRRRLIIRLPWLARALFSIDWRPEPGLKTLAVDKKWRGYYDPDLEQVAPDWIPFIDYILEHEVGHMLRRHAERGEKIGASGKNWNLAADLEINDDLGVEIPNACYPKHFGLQEGLSAEKYYEALKQNKGQGQGQGKDEDPNGKGCSGSFDKEINPDDERPGISEREQREIIKDAAREITSKRGIGSGPGRKYYDWARKVLSVDDDWKAKLRKMLQGAIGEGIRTERTRKISSRTTEYSVRYRHEDRGGKIGLLVDTSGSMSNDIPVAMIIAEKIASGFACDVIYAACDTEVVTAKSLGEFKKIMKGGGGTDLRPGFEKLDSMGCQVIFVITDGHTPWPDRVRAKVLLGITRGGIDPNSAPFPAVGIGEKE